MATAPEVIDTPDEPETPPDPVNPPAPANDPPGGEPESPAAEERDWRAEMAGDDEKLLKYLGRVASPKALVEKVKKHEDDVKGGKYLSPLPDDPTSEQLAAYRKQWGIPEKPEGYLENLPDGLVIGEDDKPVIDQFAAAMHAQNAPPGIAQAAIAFYYDLAAKQAADDADMLATNKQANDDILREEWGPDYRRTINAVGSYLDTLPQGVASAFLNGTDDKGMPLGDNVEVAKWLAAKALQENPLLTVVPGAGANQAVAIAEEKAEIEKVMRTDRAKYDKDEKMQARYRELIEAELKLAGKA